MKTASRKTWMTSRYGEAGSLEVPRIEVPEINIPDVPRAFTSWRSSVAGIEGESLDSQLAEYFGVKEGVLVRSVVSGSAAEKAGLRAGDVIVKIDDTRVTNPREISAGIRSSRSKKSVPVQLVRDKREVTLHLSVDDPASKCTTPCRNATGSKNTLHQLRDFSWPRLGQQRPRCARNVYALRLQLRNTRFVNLHDGRDLAKCQLLQVIQAQDCPFRIRQALDRENQQTVQFGFLQ